MGIRTPGLVIANDALYQLSYTPKLFHSLRLTAEIPRSVLTGSPPVLPPDDFRRACFGPEKSGLNEMRIGLR